MLSMINWNGKKRVIYGNSASMRPGMIVCLVLPVFFLLLLAAPSRSEEGRQLITSADLEPLYCDTVRKNAPWPSKIMEITDVKTYPPRIWVPDGAVSYEVRKISSRRFLGRVAMEIAVMVNGVSARSVRVCGRIEAYRDVPCAARDLTRGAVIKRSSLTTARMPVSKLRNHIPDSLESLIGMALRHSVRAGQIMTARLVAPPVVVKRGSRITILAQSPGITVRVPGKAVEQGAAGDFIRVKNLQSKREILARVRDGKTVTVIF